jgi:hypothetical protein
MCGRRWRRRYITRSRGGLCCGLGCLRCTPIAIAGWGCLIRRVGSCI